MVDGFFSSVCHMTVLRLNYKSSDFFSQFPGDYAPIHGTVIGALKRNLGLNVYNLSRDKKEDLRPRFNCWMSKKLEENLPYR